MTISQEDETIGVQYVGAPGPNAASGACALFSDAKLPWGCQLHQPPGEVITRLSNVAVAFEDPPHVHGTGDPSGGVLPANGVMVYRPSPSSGFPFFEETCVLPVSEHAVCTVLLNDVLASSTASATTATTTTSSSTTTTTTGQSRAMWTSPGSDDTF
jgi:hypothetical protein